MDQSDQRSYRLNVHEEEVSIQIIEIQNKTCPIDDLLEDNLRKYPPFEDDWMHKLIQMEESIFLH